MAIRCLAFCPVFKTFVIPCTRYFVEFILNPWVIRESLCNKLEISFESVYH